MGLQLITIGIALPVQIHHHRGLCDIWNEFFVLLDKSIKLVSLCFLLVLGTLSHQDLQNLSKPFLDLSALKILAERMEGISLTLEFSGGVDLVCHNAGNGLLNIF